jgi:alpha-beta hydrolase superfamily lysophospholipase
MEFKTDGLRLRGTLHRPPRPLPPVVIGLHGLLSDSTSPKQIALAECCNRKGIAYFRFDHRGCGTSQGRFQEVTTLENRCRDLLSAAALIRSQPDLDDRIGLFGSSLGGTVCLASAHRIAPAALVTLAAPLKSASVSRSRVIGGAGPGLPISFYRQNLRFDIAGCLGGIRNLLIVHGESDDIVPVSNARTLFHAVSAPKRLIVQPGGDHRVSNPEHQRQFLRHASLWFASHLKS